MNIKEIQANYSIRGEPQLLITLDKAENKAVQNFLDGYDTVKPYELEIKRKRKRRSIDANAYAWVLLDKIAKKLNSTKEEIYKEAITKVGVFEIILLQDKAVEAFIKKWDMQGSGYIAEVLYPSHAVEACTTVRIYYGSHTYDTGEMARLIEYIAQEAKDLGIETKPPEEIEIIINLWNKGKGEK